MSSNSSWVTCRSSGVTGRQSLVGESTASGSVSALRQSAWIRRTAVSDSNRCKAERRGVAVQQARWGRRGRPTHTRGSPLPRGARQLASRGNRESPQVAKRFAHRPVRRAALHGVPLSPVRSLPRQTLQPPGPADLHFTSPQPPHPRRPCRRTKSGPFRRCTGAHRSRANP
jgi:hypothetical protein